MFMSHSKRQLIVDNKLISAGPAKPVAGIVTEDWPRVPVLMLRIFGYEVPLGVERGINVEA